MTRGCIISGARLVDPAHLRDEVADLYIAEGHFVATPPVDADIIAAQGHIVLPGLIDTRAFQIDAKACARGGITTLCLMPDQSPPLDAPALVAYARSLGGDGLDVYPYMAATRQLAGEELAEMGLGKQAGAVGIASGRAAIASSLVMHRALTYAGHFGLPFITHAEDRTLTQGRVATAGETATRVGLPAAPAFAEALAIARDLRLAAASGVHLHIAQVTTAEGVDLVRRAKAQGQRVSCGITPAHLLLNDQAAGSWRTHTHLAPPLRAETDRLAMIAALADGTIDLLASGHDARTTEEKRLPYAQSKPGMAGFETVLQLGLSLVHNGHISLARLVELTSINPARLFGLPGGSLAVGAVADIVLVDMDRPGQIRARDFVGSGRNSAFDGLPISGAIVHTFKRGRQVYL